MGKPRQLCYDGAGRLNQVVDAATNTTETYVWNADGTLASFPGLGYTRLLEYDEEGRLVRIRQDYGGSNVQLAYECGYGFDGGGRWRKHYLNGVWTRYPCGVACGAGDLVEHQKPLEGGSWTVMRCICRVSRWCVETMSGTILTR
jgi:YD repeat-containing protein